MVIMTGEIIIILLIIIFIASIAIKIKKKRELNLISALMLFVGIYLIFSYYFMPFPLNPTGYKAIGDEVLPLNEAITLTPFTNMLFDLKHADAHYYFGPIVPMMSGAALLGFSFFSLFKKANWTKLILALSTLIPIGLFSIHAVLRLITGIMWKRADVTDIIWFLSAFWIGYGFSYLNAIILGNADKSGKENGSVE